MSPERFVSCSMACLLVALGGAATAGAKSYALTGGGGQLAIGKVLPLPVQMFTPSMTRSVFPPLGIPARIGAGGGCGSSSGASITIQGTTAMSVQQKLSVPTGVLSRPAQQATLGVFGQNPNAALYAVATNLGFQWPAAAAVFSTQARTGAKTTTFSTLGGVIRYSNALASKFGGPAQFAVSYGPPAGRVPGAPVTLYAIAVLPQGAPPCTHTLLTPTTFPGTFATPACVAALGAAMPSSLAAIGGPVGFSGGSYSPPGPPLPGVGYGRFGASPAGTVSYFTFTPNETRTGFTNAATSAGFPWTTGMLTISHPLAGGVGELFTLTGMDDRTPGGAGTIQLVAGSLSRRTQTGYNANRGWVRLELNVRLHCVPTMSPAGFAATAGLLLLAAGYALRRRFSA